MTSAEQVEFELSRADRAAIQRYAAAVAWRNRLLIASIPVVVGASIFYATRDLALAAWCGVAMGALCGGVLWWRTTAIVRERTGTRLIGAMEWGRAMSRGRPFANGEWVIIGGMKTFLGDARSREKPALGSIDRTTKQGFLLAILNARGLVTYALPGYDPHAHAKRSEA